MNQEEDAYLKSQIELTNIFDGDLIQDGKQGQGKGDNSPRRSKKNSFDADDPESDPRRQKKMMKRINEYDFPKKRKSSISMKVTKKLFASIRKVNSEKQPITACLVWTLAIIFFITTLALLAMSLLILLTSRATSKAMMHTQGGLAILKEYLTPEPIMDIKITQDKCMLGDMQNLYLWPGLESEDKTLYSKHVIRDWGGVRFCVEKANPYDYVITNECPDGYRECFRGMCFAKEKQCPISSFNFVTANVTDDGKQLPSGNYFVVNRDPTEPPVIDFFISLYDKPCLDSSLRPLNLLTQDYPLMRDPATGCGDLGQDPMFKSVESRKLKSIIEHEGRLGDVISQPGFDKYAESWAYFGYRQGLLLGTTPSSKQGIRDLEEFLKMDLSDSVLVASIVLFCVVGVLIWVLGESMQLKSKVFKKFKFYFTIVWIVFYFLTGAMYSDGWSKTFSKTELMVKQFSELTEKNGMVERKAAMMAKIANELIEVLWPNISFMNTITNLEHIGFYIFGGIPLVIILIMVLSSWKEFLEFFRYD